MNNRDNTPSPPDYLMSLLMLITLLLVGLAVTGCSYYELGYSETRQNQDGSPITSKTEITKLVPPGGKDLSEENIDMGIDSDGAWNFSMGQSSETDMGGTAAMIQGLMGQYAQLAAQAQQLQSENQQLRQFIQRQQNLPTPE